MPVGRAPARSAFHRSVIALVALRAVPLLGANVTFRLSLTLQPSRQAVGVGGKQVGLWLCVM